MTPCRSIAKEWNNQNQFWKLSKIKNVSLSIAFYKVQLRINQWTLQLGVALKKFSEFKVKRLPECVFVINIHLNVLFRGNQLMFVQSIAMTDVSVFKIKKKKYWKTAIF